MRRRVSPFSRPCFMACCAGERSASIWAEWRSSFTSSPLWRCWCRLIAGCRWACAKWSHCWALRWPVLFFLVWWLYDAISLGSLPCRRHFSWFLCPRWGRTATHFRPQGVRTSWLVAHITALLLAYVALCFSLLASVLYLIQERRIKSQAQAGTGLLVGAVRLASAAGYAGAHCPRDAGVRLSLHDGGPGNWLGAGAGDAAGRGLFSRSQDHCGVCEWAVYVLLLLVRRSAGLRGRKAAYLSGAVFVVMLASGPPTLFSHVHRYGAQ